MKTLICALAIGFAITSFASEAKLPPVSFERLEEFNRQIRKAPFPIRLGEFIQQLGGERELLLTGFSSDEVFLRFCAPNSAGGIFQIRVRTEHAAGEVLLDRICADAQIVYVSESPMHIFILEVTPKREPIQATETTRRK